MKILGKQIIKLQLFLSDKPFRQKWQDNDKESPQTLEFNKERRQMRPL